MAVRSKNTLDCYLMDRPGALRLGPRPIPILAPGQILLRTVSVSICATDVAYWRGLATPDAPWPIVPGHEYIGELVDAHGAVPGMKIGDLVTYWGQTDFVGLAEFRAISPVTSSTDQQDFYTNRHFCDATGAAVAVVPRAIPLHLAPLAEPLTAVLRLLYSYPPEPGDRVAVLGAGTCGLLAIQALRALGCGEIVVLEVDPYRRQLARQLGAESVFDPGNGGAEIDRLERDTQGDAVDMVIDLLPDIGGLPGEDVRSMAMRLLRPGGKYLLYGAPEGPQPLNHWLVLSKGLQLLAAGFDMRRFPMWRTAAVLRSALRMLESGIVDPAPLVTNVIKFGDLDEVNEAFANHARDNRMKTAVLFD